MSHVRPLPGVLPVDESCLFNKESIVNRKLFLPLALWIFLTAVDSSMAQPVVLISTNAVWRYLDDGSDQASAFELVQGDGDARPAYAEQQRK